MKLVGLHSDAQQAVDAALESSELPAAAVVLSVPETRVLALGRHRGADPVKLLARPGSTVKPILAWLAADTGVIEPRETRTCDGTYPGGFRCYDVHGPLGLSEALAVSCNVYGFELAHRLGLARMARGFFDFGLVQPTGLVPGEATGWMADPAWMASHPGSAQTPWELLVGLGHGPIEVTLLGVASAYAKLGRLLSRPSQAVSDELRREILEGLRWVVDGERGTGRAAAVSGRSIAGKTGTAEALPYRDGETSQGPENGWFVGFSPALVPQVVVAVVVLGGGNGGRSAAPLAGRILGQIARE